MDGPKHQAYGVPPQGEEDHDAFQQAAEIARWSKELHLNERAASDLYDKNHDLIMQFLGTNPTLYVELLKIICDNKNLRREKAQGIYEDKLTQYMQGHKKEPEDPEKSNQHVEPHTSPAPPPASMPSSISAVPQDTSRCNSILLDSIEVVSPAPLPETRPEDLADAVADAAPISKDQTARESQQPASTPAVSAIAPSEAPQTADDKLRSAASSAYNHTDEAPKDMNSNKRPASTELQQQPAAKRPKEHSNPQAVPAKPAGDQNGQPDHKKKKKKKHSLKASHATPLTDRTITFDEVANNQMHYDTIVEYPPGCGNYYILFCKEHSVHFKYKLPIGGAAKHLFSPLHGEPKKSWPRAVELLGYLVTGCNDQLKTEHNRKVEKKFESGHIPQNQRSKFLPPKKPPQAKPPAPPAAKAQMQTPSTPKPSAPAPGDRPKDITTPPSAWANGIFYPKTFHIYQAKWGTGNGATHYPVMILDWDSQADSGLGGTLNDTQLLDAGGDPPGCYQYDQPVEKIIGWEDGYEDGGPKVASRKFPVLFFDAQKSAAWIFGRSLKRYPLYEDLQDQKERKKQLEVRRWIARREGFTTWKERQTVQPGATFDEARLNLPQDESSPQIPYTRSPSVATTLEQSVQITNPEEDVDGGSEAMDMDDSDSSLDCETSQDAELKKLLETAGEIPGDQDYTDSQETADPDLDMADTASPSKAYRKSFISTRSTDKGDTVLVTASSGRLRGTPANVRSGMSQAQVLSEEALHMRPALLAEAAQTTGTELLQRPQTSPSIQASQTTSPASVPTCLPSASAFTQGDSALDEAISEEPITKSQSLRDSAEPASKPEDLVLHSTTIDKDYTGADGFTGTAAAAKPDDGPTPVSASSPKSGFDDTGRAAAAPHIQTSGLPQPPRWDSMLREAASAISAAASASASASPAPSATAHPHIEFTLQLYSRGTTYWEKTSADVPSIKVVSEGDVLMSVDSAVEVAVRPSVIRTFMRQPYGTDNYKMVLVPAENKEEAMHLVFGSGPGSQGESGKRQSRRFVQWIQQVNPSLEALVE